MYKRRSIVFILPLLAYFTPVLLTAENSTKQCFELKNCTDCSKQPECMWCSQPGKEYLPRCDTRENHQQRQPKCSEKMLFSHKNVMSVVRNDSLSDDSDEKIPIQPQKISLQLRVNDSISFDMRYKDVVDYPLDLYYLMDGTYSMKDDKDVLETLGDAIGERLRTLTSKFSQGFGTFVDKVTMPFASRIPAILNNPCLTKDDTCIPSYSFKNHMPLSNNTRRFTDAVKDFKLSASTDFAEGGLDALMQVMVCEKEIGWSKQARRLVIFATDGAFHYAGDGRLGGIVLPNDCKCHMDGRGEYYTHSLFTDYPSMAQINSNAKLHSMNIIFAVTSDIIEDYRTLAREIEGSAITELAKNSSNIVDLVEEQYKEIQSKVEIKDNFPTDLFKVKYYSKCKAGGVERETNICDRLEPGAVIQFRVVIELIKCPTRKEEWKRGYRIYTQGVPDSIELNVETLCDCPCENPQNGKPDSELCNKKGTELCGLCSCHTGYFGEFCECNNSTTTWINESVACKKDNSTDTCSGRGNCICSQCECSDKRYSGPYCECDNESCELSPTNGQLCNGQGTCDCGNCICNPGWSGSGCGCSTETDVCNDPVSKKECNGEGTCVCGQCQCKREFGGKYCEKCRDESCQKCDELKSCVQCKVFGTGDLNPAECELNCFKHDLQAVDNISDQTTFHEEEVICRREDPTDECVFTFSYYKIISTGKYKILAYTSKECPPQAPIFWIITIVSSLVVLVGLILLCVYRQYRKLQVRIEYKAYKKEKDGLDWDHKSNQNPLYNDPIGTFNNPLHPDNN